MEAAIPSAHCLLVRLPLMWFTALRPVFLSSKRLPQRPPQSVHSLHDGKLEEEHASTNNHKFLGVYTQRDSLPLVSYIFEVMPIIDLLSTSRHDEITEI